MQPLENRKRRFGDRKDGFLIRNLPPMSKLIPYIMKSKSDSWVLFEDEIDITKTEEFIHKMRKSEIPGLTLYHLIFAAIVRTYSQNPELNRFVSGSNVYARNEVRGSMVVMKGMQKDSEETMIMPKFDLDDTLPEVVEKIEKETAPLKSEEAQEGSSFDRLEFALGLFPNFLIGWFFAFIKWLDKHGWIPSSITAISPFHSSFFITNVGSLGLRAVNHHIYEFGTISIFGAIGSKRIAYEPDRNGELHRKVYLNMKFVVDERICNGLIFAMGFRRIKKCISSPEQLMKKPEQIIHDQIDK